MQKDTSEIVKELGLSPDFQTFYNENKTEWQRIKHIIDCLIGTDC